MVVFVNAEVYLSAYDNIRTTFRTSQTPVQIFCGISADTIGCCGMLLGLLKTDLVNFEVHPIHTTDDIVTIIKSHDIFTEAEHAFQCIFLNCGASIPLPSLLDVESLGHIHVLDSHGPVHLEILLHASTTLYVWDTGSVLRDIEHHFARSLRPTQPSQRAKRTREGATGTEDGEDDHDSNDLDDDFSWDLLADLTPEDEARYYSMRYRGVSPSKVLFDIALALRSSADDDILWYRSVSLTDSHLHEISTSEAYSADMFKVQEQAIVSGLSKQKHRQVVLQDRDTNMEDVVMVESYHRVKVETTTDHRLLLLHHWNLWEALRHDPYPCHRLNLVANDSAGRERLKDLLAHIGVTVKEAQTKWTELPTTRRDEILKLVVSEGHRLYGMQRLTYRSIAKRHGYGFWCSATDMVHALHHLLSASGPEPRQGFLKGLAAIRNREVGQLHDTMAATVEHYTNMLQQASALLQKSSVTMLKSFRYVFLSEEDTPPTFLSPVCLRSLARYILPSMPKKDKARPLLIGALDSVKAQYVLCGCSPAGVPPMASHFARAAKDYPTIVRHPGIDKDWITVHRDQVVFVLEAIHLAMMADRRLR